MSAETEAMRQDIDGIRDSMTETLEYLETRLRTTVDGTMEQMRQSLDLERQVRERPWVALGLATLAGYILGSLDEGPQGAYAVHAGGPPAMPSEFSGALGTISAAAATSVTSILRESLSESLPYFEEEYARLRSERA